MGTAVTGGTANSRSFETPSRRSETLTEANVAAAEAAQLVSGTKKFVDGGRYEGQLRDGRKQGKGVFTYANGDYYDGAWDDNKAHGDGTFKTDNSVYIGQFKHDVKH